MQLFLSESIRTQHPLANSSLLSPISPVLSEPPAGYIQDEATHSHCQCQLCRDNVKPIPKPEELRETHQDEVTLANWDGFLFLLRKAAGYRGIFFVPDIIYFQEGTMFYTNDQGRMKAKDKVTNLQAKKFYDERKFKARYAMRQAQSQRQKDHYILVYKDGTEQIMNEQLYSKILAKRKNDPFWLEVNYSYRLPETRETKGSVKSYFYQRTKPVAEHMLPVMKLMMKDIDSHDQKVQVGVKEASLEFASQITMRKTFTELHKQVNNSSIFLTPLIKPGKKNLNVSSLLKTPTFNIQTIVQDLIAYLQVSSKTRVLQIEVDYSEEQTGQPVVIGLRKLVYHDLLPQEENYLHNRFKALEAKGEEELIQLKKQCDRKDEETLWEVCTRILETCLDARRIKLNIQGYRRPSKQVLREIFMKIFPHFSAAAIFSNLNWQNEFSGFMQETRDRINSVIQEDEGISMLKRFGIVFYRTF